MCETINSALKESKRKKRKAKAEEVAGSSTTEGAIEEEEQPPGRDWTLSIALPGSILDNAQSFELRLIKVVFQLINSTFLGHILPVRSLVLASCSMSMKLSFSTNLAKRQRTLQENSRESKRKEIQIKLLVAFCVSSTLKPVIILFF